MTHAQRVLKQFVRDYYNTDAEIIGEDEVIVNNKILTINIYCDIIDKKNKKIIAESNLYHDLLSIGTKLPTKWILKSYD